VDQPPREEAAGIDADDVCTGIELQTPNRLPASEVENDVRRPHGEKPSQHRILHGC
jgi:hypothetical protein